MTEELVASNYNISNGGRNIVRTSDGTAYVVAQDVANSAIECLKRGVYLVAGNTSSLSAGSFYSFPKYGQSFQNVLAGNITKASASLYKDGSPDGTITAKLYAHSGTFGTSSVPTGTALATSNSVACSTLSTSAATVEFTFDTPYAMSASTYYVIAFEWVGTYDTDNKPYISNNYSNPVAGNESVNYAGWSPSAGYDLVFQVYSDAAWTKKGTGPTGTLYGSCSCAIDSNGIIHVAYFSDAGKASPLYYATFSTVSDTWTATDTSLVSDIGEDPTLSSLYTAIAVDSSDVPHIVFNEYPKISGTATYILSYINKVGGSWNSVVNIDYNAGNDCAHPDLCFDHSATPGYPVLVYQQTATGYTGVARGNANNATSFTLHNVATDTPSSAPTIAVDSSGNAWVAYRTSSYLYLHPHASGDGWTTWSTRVTDSGDTLASSTISLFIDDTDIHVFLSDGSSDVVHNMYDGTSTWEGRTTLNSTYTYGSVQSHWPTLASFDEIAYIFEYGAVVYFDAYPLVTGGATLSVNVSDSVTVGESATVTLPDALAKSVSESVTVGESVTVRLSSSINTVETVTVGEAVTVTITSTITASDAVTVGESVTVVMADALSVNVMDAVTVGETSSVLLPDALAISATDAVTVGESVTVELPDALSVDISDAVTVGETTNAAISDAEINVTDAITTGEDVTVEFAAIGSLDIDVTDTVTVGEDVAVELPDALAVAVSDASTIGETANVIISDAEINVTDTITTSEDVTVELGAIVTLNVDVSDVVTTGEDVTVEIADALAVDATDSVTTGETVTVELPDALTFDITDAVTVGEDVTIALEEAATLTVSISDDVTIGEDVTVTLPDALAISATDAVTVGESVTVELPDALAVDVTAGITVGEAVTIKLPDALEVSASESVTVGEVTDISLGEAGAFEISVADALTVDELASVEMADMAVDVTDIITVGESVTVAFGETGAFEINVSDAATVGESVTIELPDALSVEANDAVTVAEAVSVTLPDALAVSVTDATTVGESVNISIVEADAFTISVTDAVTVGESISIDPLALPDISATDAVIVGEDVTITISEPQSLSVDVTDLLTIGESVTITPLLLTSINVSDSVTISETTSLLVEFFGTVAAFGTIFSPTNVSNIFGPANVGNISSLDNVGDIFSPDTLAGIESPDGTGSVLSDRYGY